MRPIIRTNFGSHARVTRVFWFDADAGSVGVELEDGHCAEMQTSELEAVRGSHYVDLLDLLRQRAGAGRNR